jgi:hypothetical protein
MPRSKTPVVSLEEAKVRFEEWRNNRRGKPEYPLRFGRLLSRWLVRKGLIEPRGSCMWRGTI